MGQKPRRKLSHLVFPFPPPRRAHVRKEASKRVVVVGRGTHLHHFQVSRWPPPIILPPPSEEEEGGDWPPPRLPSFPMETGRALKCGICAVHCSWSCFVLENLTIVESRTLWLPRPARPVRGGPSPSPSGRRRRPRDPRGEIWKIGQDGEDKSVKRKRPLSSEQLFRDETTAPLQIGERARAFPFAQFDFYPLFPRRFFSSPGGGKKEGPQFAATHPPPPHSRAGERAPFLTPPCPARLYPFFQKKAGPFSRT